MIAMILWSCAEEPDYFIDPVADIQASNTEVSTNEFVTFTNSGKGQKITLFTGKAGEMFLDGTSSADDIQTGVELTAQNPSYSTSYTVAGEYTAVLVATGFKNGGTDIQREIDQVTITVKDTVTTIKSIQFSMVKDKATGGIYSIFLPPSDVLIYNLEIFPDDDNNVIVPVHDYAAPSFDLYKVTTVIRNYTDYSFQPLVVSSSLSLSYEIEGFPSDFVNNGSQIINHAGADNFSPREYKVINNGEAVNSYNVIPVIIPYFSSFNLQDDQGNTYDYSIDISRANYAESVLNFILPAEVDVSTLTPSYIINDPNVVLTFENAEGGEDNYSGDGEIIYRLSFKRPKSVDDSYQGDAIVQTRVFVRVSTDEG